MGNDRRLRIAARGLALLGLAILGGGAWRARSARPRPPPGPHAIETVRAPTAEAPATPVGATPTAAADEQASAPRSPGTWLRKADLAGRTRSEAFEAEPRDPVWAPAMERAIGAALAPHVEALPGASLTELRCQATACRLALALTPALKARLNLEAPGGVGFALDRLVGAGVGAPLARATDALWDDEEVPFWVRPLGSLGSWLDDERCRTLTRETVILMFDEASHDPATYGARIAASRERRANRAAHP